MLSGLVKYYCTAEPYRIVPLTVCIDTPQLSRKNNKVTPFPSPVCLQREEGIQQQHVDTSVEDLLWWWVEVLGSSHTE